MNENQEENMSVEKLISDMIDMLCTEKPSCSAINNVVCEDSKSSDESDNTSWTTKHYRLGIAAFLPKTLKSKKVLTRKRTMSPEMRGEASLRQDSVVAAKTAKLTGEQELSNNVPRQRCSNFHEIYRDKETFEVKSLGFGFSIGHSCNNYIKSCQWSSCGKYLATVSQDRFARIFEFLPEKPELDAKSTISMGDLVYDSCWHPVSSCFVGSSKDHPIHMWDSNGHWLATFRGMNSMASF
ncbi:unnamed protein product [Thelazia callipaeda]|uniref:WD repeat-containing protein 79 n=1 Tax=Thelazia callipaeda TaxID=103827 RepID=A0A0N5CRE3_THECL|nr:unnamed protein product [Thelazia callipaeda]